MTDNVLEWSVPGCGCVARTGERCAACEVALEKALKWANRPYALVRSGCDCMDVGGTQCAGCADSEYEAAHTYPERG